MVLNLFPGSDQSDSPYHNNPVLQQSFGDSQLPGAQMQTGSSSGKQ